MAKYKGILSSDARGKLNGVVFSRNTFGTYIRALASPVQPRTTYQQEVRSALATIAKQWRDLSQTQRDGWNALASQVPPRTDSLGNAYQLTGFQLFCELNFNGYLTTGAIPSITNPPAQPVNVPSPQTVTVAATGGPTPSLTVAWTGGSTNFDAMIFATATLSTGIRFIKPSDFRLIARTQSGAGSPPIAILTQWQARFGPPPDPPQGKVAVAVKLQDTNTFFGSVGPLQYGVDTW